MHFITVTPDELKHLSAQSKLEILNNDKLWIKLCRNKNVRNPAK